MLEDPRVVIQNFLLAGVTKPCLDPAVRASWLAAVHESMRVSGGAVTTAVEEPTVGRNYYRVGVQLRGAVPLALLLNAAAGLVAAAAPGDHHSIVLVFADVPHSAVFSRAGFRVGTPPELDQALQEEHLRLLADDERRDAAYHQPSRLGDLLFNWFD